MKNIFVNFLILLLFCFVFFDLSKFFENNKSLKNKTGALYSKDGREEYFFNRLKDPKTGEIPKGIRQAELQYSKRIPIAFGKQGQTIEWNKRGPSNVGGRTRALCFDIDDSDVIMAGGVTAGIYKSTNGGNSFEKKTRPDQLHSVTSIEQDRRSGKHNIWYAGTGEYYAIVSAASFSARASGNGIYKSTDNGESWDLLPSTVSNTPTTLHDKKDFDFVWRIVTDHTELNKDVVYAAVVNGIFRSEDGGLTWDSVLGLDTTISTRSDYTDIMITESGILYATLGNNSPSKGIYRSTDGINWVNITPSGFPNTYRRIVMDYFRADENKLCFLAETPNRGKNDHSLWYYRYLTGDGSGANGQWQSRTSNLPDYNCNLFYDFIFGTFKSQNSYDLAIALHPQDSNIIAIGGIDLFVSTDGFKSNNNYNWIGGYQCDTINPANYIYPNHHPDVHLIKFNPDNPNELFTASDGGIHKTSNYLSNKPQWTSLNNNYLTAQFYTAAIEPGNTSNNIVVGGLQDNGTWFTNSSDFNSPWNSVFYGDGAYCEIVPGRSNYYLSWQTGKIFKFEIDDSGNVLGKTRIDPANLSGHIFIHPFILDPVTYNKMYTPNRSYIYVQDNLDSIEIVGNELTPISQGWRKINESYANFNIFDPGSSSGYITALEMSVANNKRLYYGTSDAKFFRLDSLDTTPVRITLWDTIFPIGAYVSSIAVSDKNPDELVVSFSNYNVKSIFYSEDAGDTWTDISGNLEENPDGSGNGPAVFWVEFLHRENNNDILYAGTSTGLYSLEELSGTTFEWHHEGTDIIGNIPVNMIKTRSYDEQVLVATHGNGMYSTRFKDISSIDENINDNEVLVLHQNRPNPFTNETKIKFSLSKSDRVSLTIYDLQGRVVRQLFNGELEPGTYNFDWDCKDKSGVEMTSGMYIYKLNNKNRSWSNRMIKL